MRLTWRCRVNRGYPTADVNLNITSMSSTPNRKPYGYWDITSKNLCHMVVPIDQVDAAPHQRPLQQDFLRKLMESINQYEKRYHNRIHIVLPKETRSEAERLFVEKVMQRQEIPLEEIPKSIRFLSIDGWHRITASKKHVEDLRMAQVEPAALCWPAVVYPAGLWFHIFSDCTYLRFCRRV